MSADDDETLKSIGAALQSAAKRDFDHAANSLAKETLAMSVVANIGFSFISIQSSDAMPGLEAGHRALVVVISGKIDESILVDVARYAAGACQDAHMGQPVETLHSKNVQALGIDAPDTAPPNEDPT